jgi:hypothetical protein
MELIWYMVSAPEKRKSKIIMNYYFKIWKQNTVAYTPQSLISRRSFRKKSLYVEKMPDRPWARFTFSANAWMYASHSNDCFSKPTKSQIRCLNKGCPNYERQVVVDSIYLTASPNICGFPVWNFYHFTSVAPRIWRGRFYIFESVWNPGFKSGMCVFKSLLGFDVVDADTNSRHVRKYFEF